VLTGEAEETRGKGGRGCATPALGGAEGMRARREGWLNLARGAGRGAFRVRQGAAGWTRFAVLLLGWRGHGRVRLGPGACEVARRRVRVGREQDTTRSVFFCFDIFFYFLSYGSERNHVMCTNMTHETTCAHRTTLAGAEPRR
jgi:hypothetical protein